MTAATLIIGDEILIGQVKDTNSAAISASLNDCGIRTLQMRSVGDDAQSVSTALAELLRIADIVVITGGLGPTKDDKTKSILAQYFGATKMVEHSPTLLRVQEFARKGGFAMNDLNRRQAFVPDVCQVLPNAVGTAPGMWFEDGGKITISLPGVPFEMEHILRCEVIPRLKARFALPPVVHSTALIFGIAESMLAQRIEHWENDLPPHLHLAYLPSQTGAIRLRLSNYDTLGSESEKETQQRFAALQTLIPEYFVGLGDYPIEQFAAQSLLSKNCSVSSAESCTGGTIASLLTSIAGSSAYFRGGIVAYDNSVKTGGLGVSADDIERHGAVSGEVVRQMAQGVQRLMGTDFAVATSGVAGPGGGTPDKPVGTVWIAVASPNDTAVALYHFGNRPRRQIIERSSAAALYILMRQVEKI